MRNLDKLKINCDGLEIYRAGWPYFPSNFVRESIISAILIRDIKMLKNQLLF